MRITARMKDLARRAAASRLAGAIGTANELDTAIEYIYSKYAKHEDELQLCEEQGRLDAFNEYHNGGKQHVSGKRI